jgi:cytochrome c peroxidase
MENPMKNRLNPALVARGREVFKEENCARCHQPPDYSGTRLMPVVGYEVPENHPFKDLIRPTRIDTDPGLALKTRKGTGLYKIPSLRGLWYRGLFGHDGSVSSLEDWFDPARLKDDYEPTGWKGPGVEHRAVPGHEYGLDLTDEDKRALIAFLETL